MHVDFLLLLCIGVVTGGPPACNHNFVNQPAGELSSPSYPQTYPSNVICNYRIQVKEPDHVVFKLKSMQTGIEAGHDFLMVFDGKDCLSKRLGFYSQNSQMTVTSQKSEMTLLFVSDMGMPDKGFTGNFSAETDVSPGRLIRDSIYFSPNGGDALLYCGGEMTTEANTLNVPITIRLPSVCIWRIKADSHQIININISGLQAFTKHNWLRVLDGGSCDQNTLLYVHSITTQDVASTKTTGNEAVIIAVRQPKGVEKNAFKISYAFENNPARPWTPFRELKYYYQAFVAVVNGTTKTKFSFYHFFTSLFVIVIFWKTVSL